LWQNFLRAEAVRSLHRCLAVIGRAFGLQRTKALVLRTIVPSQIAMLRLFGIEIVKSDSFIEREQEAAKLAEENGWFHANQRAYPRLNDRRLLEWPVCLLDASPLHFALTVANSNNQAAQRRWTGKETWEQMPSITVFAAGMGSTGTIVGAGQ
jgi:cysteine synthase